MATENSERAEEARIPCTFGANREFPLGEWFAPDCVIHTSVSMVSDASENRAKSARVRAILDRARTRRAPWSAQIGRIGQNLSGRDFARSIGEAVGDRKNLTKSAPPRRNLRQTRDLMKNRQRRQTGGDLLKAILPVPTLQE